MVDVVHLRMTKEGKKKGQNELVLCVCVWLALTRMVMYHRLRGAEMLTRSTKQKPRIP